MIIKQKLEGPGNSSATNYYGACANVKQNFHEVEVARFYKWAAGVAKGLYIFKHILLFLDGEAERFKRLRTCDGKNSEPGWKKSCSH
jgi:hypothetical protein